MLIVLAVVLVSLILVVAVLHGDRLDTTLEFCLVLTVAAIPVAMPTVLSVTMAVGARLLSTKGAIVSRLAAIEELAGVDVLCSDKTGTLTKNQLTLGEPFVRGGGPAEPVLLAAALASRRENDDTIDGAVLDGLADPAALDGFKVLAFQPFDPVRKRTEASIEGPGAERFRVAKGAPQAILALVSEAEGSGPADAPGRRRLRRPGLPFPGGGPHRSQGPLAAAGGAAPVRPAAGRFQGHDRHRPADGREGADGDGGSGGDRP